MLSQVVPPFQERVFFWAQLKDSINKGRFRFLKIDATNAFFLLGSVDHQTNADSSYLSQNRFGCQTGAFVQVLGTFDQKNGATTFSAVSSKPAGWCAKGRCSLHQVPHFNGPPSADRYLASIGAVWSDDRHGGKRRLRGSSQDKFRTNCSCELSLPCKIAESTVPTGKLSSLSRTQSWSTKKKSWTPFFPYMSSIQNSYSDIDEIGSLLAKTIRTWATKVWGFSGSHWTNGALKPLSL